MGVSQLIVGNLMCPLSTVSPTYITHYAHETDARNTETTQNRGMDGRCESLLTSTSEVRSYQKKSVSEEMKNTNIILHAGASKQKRVDPPLGSDHARKEQRENVYHPIVSSRRGTKDDHRR